MVERTCEFLNLMKSRNVPIKCIRLDPAGENSALQSRVQSVDWQSLQPIKFEFTSRETLQHNNLAMLAFPFLLGKARAMMSAAFIPSNVCGKVAIKAVCCVMQIDGLTVVDVEGKSKTRDEHVFHEKPGWVVNLRKWGEAGVFKLGKDGKTIPFFSRV